MEDRKHRIGIAGAAGTGKSTLAREVADRLNVPLLESKKITNDILERDSYDYASGVQIERFLASTGRQNEILRRTLEQQKVEESFVTDRTLVDLAAYVCCEMYDTDTDALRDILETCRRNVSDYTHIFFCSWEDKPVEKNQRRTLNPWYQFLIHTIERGILEEWDCSYEILPPNGDRISRVMGMIKQD